MKITLHGAAGGEVTGSAYQIRTERASLLLDFGLFQGNRRSEARNKIPVQIVPDQLDAVLVTHAHLDHTGRLPLLVKAGYTGPIYATPATIDLAELILHDSAKLQTQEAERFNRKYRKPNQPAQFPLYTNDHVNQLMPLFRPVQYDEPVPVVEGIEARFTEAGHMLGSTSIQLQVTENNTTKSVVFSGDLGPIGAPLLKDYEPFKQADAVFLESTYGDRDHKSFPATVEEFFQIIADAVARKGIILIPTFAVGRAQVLLLMIAWGIRQKRFPAFPVFLDSPMATKASQIFMEHPDLYDDDMRAFLAEGNITADMAQVTSTASAEESKALNDRPGPMLILAGNGMCTAGRIMHHLRHHLPKPETTVVIVGYQAEDSVGRQLVDRRNKVSIFGDRITVRATVHTLNGFSGHAGQTDLLAWLGVMAAARPRVFLIHGEDRARKPFARAIAERFQLTAEFPELGETITL